MRNYFEIFKIKEAATKEAYTYFDQNIRSLPKNNKGEVDQSASGFADNDVDAFRHAYVSGIFTQEFNAFTAKTLGQFQEFWGNSYGSNNTTPTYSRAMDLWNNEIGRKYGRKAQSRKQLAHLLQQALVKGELVIDLKDSRIRQDGTPTTHDSSKPVIVIQRTQSGRNEMFADTHTWNVMDRATFATQIHQGEYPGYYLANVGGVSTPKSKADQTPVNNLG